MTAPTSAPRGRIALTGAAGSLARDIIPHLRRCGYELVCLDQAEPAHPMGCEWVIASIHDADRLREAFAGCAAVVHLAGIPLEASWEEISRTNIDGTQAVLEAARAARVPKAVLASSIHATGYTHVPAEGDLLPDDVPVRPNTFYGVSKAAVEALGSLYADRYGLDVVCLRIASRFSRPENERMLSTWLSPPTRGACSRPPSPRRRRASGSSGASPATPAATSPPTAAGPSDSSPRTTPRPTPASSRRTRPGPPKARSGTGAASAACSPRPSRRCSRLPSGV
ncbi:NAD-dependent epimerase/dehydratase family protein [Sinomonas atrocyanea]